MMCYLAPAAQPFGVFFHLLPAYASPKARSSLSRAIRDMWPARHINSAWRKCSTA